MNILRKYSYWKMCGSIWRIWKYFSSAISPHFEVPPCDGAIKLHDSSFVLYTYLKRDIQFPFLRKREEKNDQRERERGLAIVYLILETYVAIIPTRENRRFTSRHVGLKVGATERQIIRESHRSGLGNQRNWTIKGGSFLFGRTFYV